MVPMEEGADSEDAAEEGLKIKSSIDAESPDGAPHTPPPPPTLHIHTQPQTHARAHAQPKPHPLLLTVALNKIHLPAS